MALELATGMNGEQFSQQVVLMDTITDLIAIIMKLIY